MPKGEKKNAENDEEVPRGHTSEEFKTQRESLRAQKLVDYVRTAYSFVKDNESDDDYDPHKNPDDGLDDVTVNAANDLDTRDEMIDDADVNSRGHGTAEGTSSQLL
uniref:Uncharacterized protein n=1 Tax=Phytophthora ramorum TaxID=164328 RepID=H3GRD7_PHYRM